MTHPTRKSGGLLGGLIARHNQSVAKRQLDRALADPHLARDIGLPHRPREDQPPLRVLW